MPTNRLGKVFPSERPGRTGAWDRLYDLQQVFLHLMRWANNAAKGAIVLSERTLPDQRSSQSKTRSRVLRYGLALFALLLTAQLGRAADLAATPAREYRLRFYHTHTCERIDIVYRRGDAYLPQALDELDHCTGEVRHFDPHLFDLLHDLTESPNDPSGEIDVICGYRTPWSNEFLRTRSPHTGVARHSLHMQAEAIDIRLPGIPTTAVRDAALGLHRGGVGYYRDSDFVHVDVGVYAVGS
jgi:uncharacterized protein YcbK (DUF882 family)